jgi:hypothetical protein
VRVLEERIIPPLASTVDASNGSFTRWPVGQRIQYGSILLKRALRVSLYGGAGDRGCPVALNLPLRAPPVTFGDAYCPEARSRSTPRLREDGRVVGD